MSETKSRLRVLTYMCPGHAVELYQTIVEYLEKVLDRPCELIYEWRATGPTQQIPDPFGGPEIAFISSFSFQQLSEEKSPDWVLLPVGGVFDHPVKGETLGYWSDLIIPTDSTDRIKELIDLRGCRIARPVPESLSGNIILLKTLRDIGENPSFFGNVLESGSHLASVQMVAMKQADCAAVDSVALQFAMEQQPSLKNEIHIFESYGPLPPYPIVVRANMDDALRLEIEQAFLKMHEDPEWAEKFAKLQLKRYESIDTQVFDIEKVMRNMVKGMTFGVRYY